jgi:hypothetical protein
VRHLLPLYPKIHRLGAYAKEAGSVPDGHRQFPIPEAKGTGGRDYDPAVSVFVLLYERMHRLISMATCKGRPWQQNTLPQISFKFPCADESDEGVYIAEKKLIIGEKLV